MLGGEAHRMLRSVAPAWTVLIYTSARPDLREAVQESLTEIRDHGAASDAMRSCWADMEPALLEP